MGRMIEFNYEHLGRGTAGVQARAARSREDHSFPPFVIRPRNRFWELSDELGSLICLTVYKRGAVEVARRLTSKSNQLQTARPDYDRSKGRVP